MHRHAQEGGARGAELCSGYRAHGVVLCYPSLPCNAACAGLPSTEGPIMSRQEAASGELWDYYPSDLRGCCGHVPGVDGWITKTNLLEFSASIMKDGRWTRRRLSCGPHIHAARDERGDRSEPRCGLLPPECGVVFYVLIITAITRRLSCLLTSIGFLLRAPACFWGVPPKEVCSGG